MKINDYQEAAMRTAGNEIDEKILGLVGETGEVADLLKKSLFHGHQMNLKDLEKELGDCLWYATNLVSAYTQKSLKQLLAVDYFDQLNGFDGVDMEPLEIIYGLSGEATSFIDARNFGDYKEAETSLYFYMLLLKELATHFMFSLDEVANKNIEKLNKRYPEGFTEADSIRRVDVK